MDPRIKKEISEAVFGKQDYAPLISFYDHAAYNEVLSKQSGRPRYTEKTYTLMKPTHPDLKVRDKVSHPTRPDEIENHPREWEIYQKTKRDQHEFKPPLQAIPGMRISYFRELQALEIFDAESLANYEGDLGEIEHLKELSKRIMEVAHEARNLRERREAVRDNPDRPAYHSTPVPGRSVITEIARAPQVGEKESHQESGKKEGIETFQYNFQVG